MQKTKIMASSPITSWQIVRETMESVADFIFLGSKITADGDCSLEIKRHLLLCPSPLLTSFNFALEPQMGIPDHLTCLLRHLYAGQEAWLEPDMEQWTGSKFGKYKSMYCHPAHLTYMQSTF